ncbi:unnamed protein product [Cuscuta campestris]|uniref:Uncharacterized protein n=1 Tax=Cuscuta campestris TaxID=132261 RepID=A0A484M7X1_9ASTE|nr:unnamed protein product [Cuscuta campestris]
MEDFEKFEGADGVNPPRDGVSSGKSGAEKMEAAIMEELFKLRGLPQYSSYVIHRLRVLNKILQLLSIQRTKTQDEELESLFAGLSIG